MGSKGWSLGVSERVSGEGEGIGKGMGSNLQLLELAARELAHPETTLKAAATRKQAGYSSSDLGTGDRSHRGGVSLGEVASPNGELLAEGRLSRKRQRVDPQGGNKEAAAEWNIAENGVDQDTSSIADSGQCQYEGCTKAARSGGRNFCRRHAEGRRCKAPGCSKIDVGGGCCRKHGGGRRCGADDCFKTDVGGGFCVSHGGGKRCQAEGCAKGAQAGGVFCKFHGGGRRCRIEGCITSAQSGTDALCIKHGGGKRCMVVGCKKLVRKSGRCTKHASEGSLDTLVRPPPVVAPASAAAKEAKTTAALAATAAVLMATTGLQTSAPVAPSPTPRRRAATSSQPEPRIFWPLSTAPRPPSPPGQREAEADKGSGYAIGGPFQPPPPVAKKVSQPSFGGSGAGVPLEGFFSPRPPVAVLGGRVAVGDDPDGSFAPDPYNSAPSRGEDARFRPTLPGINCIGSAMRGINPRNMAKEALPSGRRAAYAGLPVDPPYTPATAHLLSRGTGPPRDILPTRGKYGRGGGGGGEGKGKGTNARMNIAKKLLTSPHQDLVESSPAGGLRVDRPAPCREVRSPGGVSEKPRLLSSLPAEGLLQPPQPLSAGYSPDAVMSSCCTRGGKESEEWFGVADTGSTPTASYDRRAGTAFSSRSNTSSLAESQLFTGSERTRPKGSVTNYSLCASAGVDPPGQATFSSCIGGSSERPSTPIPAAAAAAAARSAETMPASVPQARSSCCAGGRLEPYGTAASPSPPIPAARAAPTPAQAPANTAATCGGGPQDKARSCSTSPPLEQTASFVSLSVSGMMCMENCGQTVQGALSAVPGVQSVTIHFPTKTASVKINRGAGVSPGDLVSVLKDIGFESSCVATTTTDESPLDDAGVNVVWAIANALGLVNPGCAMAWGEDCNCGDDCKCVNCPQHMKKVSHAVGLVLRAVDLSTSGNPLSPKQPELPQPQNYKDLGA